MKILDYRNLLDTDELGIVILKGLESMTTRLKCILPHGWRANVMIRAKNHHDIYKNALFRLDVQSDKGGGSWAPAKIKTMLDFEICATYEMSPAEIAAELKKRGHTCNDHYQKILRAKKLEELQEETIAWLVDTGKGPGIAPGEGGIAVPYSCFYPDNGTLEKEEGQVLIAFSGAKSYQDLQFATEILYIVQEYFDKKKDECLTLDTSALRENSDLEYWLVNLGVR